MVDQDKRNPFPQANDFEKVIKILETDEKILCDKEKLQNLIGVGSSRQVQYYLSACQFLGLIDENGKYTELALTIKNSCYENKIFSLSRLIISMPVFGEVFFKKYYYNEESSSDEIAQLISDFWNIDKYSVCKRRASTVKKWLKWIENNKEMQN